MGLPTSYTELFVWMLLAVGAALFLGTGAALLTYRRTGAFPGQSPAEEDGTTTRVDVRPVVARCLLGGVLVVASLTVLTALGDGG